MQNLLDPAILFFIFGVLAGTIKSNLEIPPAISRFLSLYLLMALGLKGGFALSDSGFNAEVGLSLAAAIVLAAICSCKIKVWLPLWARIFFLVRLHQAPIVCGKASLKRVPHASVGSY